MQQARLASGIWLFVRATVCRVVYEWDCDDVNYSSGKQEATEDNRKNNEKIYWLFRTVRSLVRVEWNLPVTTTIIFYEETNVQEGWLGFC